ncbi:hypothetical protein [Plantactinospora soyae]|uniref:DUF5872 domain-containing protein n=1 Tax=Plantactinospora soyae TaxID=1544732 RepID=A0A927M685_9ACTN|nr:hypothetical protein [Plantactinospora soyae]MBE1487767.1 hypothetical protein [Plantactinospora soyae]
MAQYTKPELREKLKEEIKASDRGGRPGQWSARKSQLLTQEYKKNGGGYQGPKDDRQKSLQHWGDQKWRNRQGTTRARHDGETDRYLPDKAWNQLSAEQQRDTDAKKRRESKSGKQYVANTGPAKRARRDSTTVPLTEMPVAEATRHVRGLNANQLKAALRAERAGKGRKTLIQRLEAALDRH